VRVSDGCMSLYLFPLEYDLADEARAAVAARPTARRRRVELSVRRRSDCDPAQARADAPQESLVDRGASA
jgi:hypothetical protein